MVLGEKHGTNYLPYTKMPVQVIVKPVPAFLLQKGYY